MYQKFNRETPPNTEILYQGNSLPDTPLILREAGNFPPVSKPFLYTTPLFGFKIGRKGGGGITLII